jgi:protein-disulfide isomerase
MEIHSPSNSPSKQTRLARAAQTRQKSREIVLMALLPVVFLLGLGLGWALWGTGSPEAAPQANAQSPQRRIDVTVAGSPALGPSDAPVTIVEFSDYQCPYCVRWYNQVYKRLVQEYEGKIRFVYRDFPLEGIHPDATPAAIAAHCAGEQDAYFLFHDALFSNKYGLGTDAYLLYATELELDLTSFQTCLAEKRYADQVEKDIRYGYSIGVSSTPTFFVNGIAIVGAQPYEVFQQLIEQELANSK